MRSAVPIFWALALVVAGQGAAADKLVPLDETSYHQMLASQKGKILLVSFWATWCEPCRTEMPQLVRLHAKQKGRAVQLVTVSADEPGHEERAMAFLNRTGVAHPVYVKRAKDDDKFINSVDPNWSGALPALFLYDRSGKMVRAFVGETTVREIEAALNQIR